MNNHVHIFHYPPENGEDIAIGKCKCGATQTAKTSRGFNLDHEKFNFSVHREKKGHVTWRS